ncbi:MAG: InlB B-repeat-containing protein, partial [Paludibacteraceae bacterium]|nr:InlB B-repeat-containing protein [Paludibacteraceae bacterium]
MSAPTAVAASSITANSATITVTDATNVNNYELYYSTSSTAPSANTAASTTITGGKSKSITGLNASTTYYVWARAYTTSPARKTGWKALTGTSFTTLCVAPNHVDVSGDWDRFGGETITLTATAYSSAGTSSPISSNISYQWQKYYNSTWNNISGATSATYTKSECDKDDSGSYRCKATTGSGCDTYSDGFQVKVYVLECYNGGTTVYNFTRTGSSKAGTVQIDLSASTNYTFKVHADNDYYGNSGTVNEDVTNWVCTTGESSNLTVASGLGGTFTFSMDYSTGGNNSTEGIPEISVTYPRKTIYLTPGVWNVDGAKFALYYFRDGGSSGWTDFITANECGSSADIPQWNGVKIDAVRLKNTCTSPNWDDKWAQTSDITVSSNNGVAITGWNESDYTYGTYAIPTDTISYDKGTYGTGTRANDTKTCGTGFTLPNTQVFTRSGYTMDGWATSNGGEKVYDLGGSYITNAAQTFYPHWAIVNYTITYNLNGGTQQITPAPATSYTVLSSAITLPTPTREGYTFNGWYANSDLSTGGVQTTIAAGSTGSKTYWAKWTINSYTVDWYVNGNKLTTGSQTTNVNHGSKVTTLPSTPSGSPCGKTFVGWTNTTSYVHGTSVLFTTAVGSPAITSATNFYAVYAAGCAPATKNLTNAEIQTFYGTPANHAYANGPFTLTSTDGNWYGVCAAEYENSIYAVNIRSATAPIGDADIRPYLQSPVYSSDVASVTITHSCTSNRTLYICSGATSNPGTDKIATISITSSNQSGVSANIPNGVNQIYLYSSSNTIQIKSIAVSIGGYSGYTLSCDECGTSITPNYTASPAGGKVAVSNNRVAVASGSTVKTCGGATLAVTITPDSHHNLTGFTATGLTTGTATITPDVASTLPKAVAQTFTISISATATGTLTLTPTFTEKPYRTVVFMNNNEALFDDGGEAETYDAINKWKQKVYIGEKPVLPTALVAGQACDDDSNTFMGWVADDQRWPGKEASGMPAGKTLITTGRGFAIAAAGSGEIAYHAVWAKDNLESDVINNSATSSNLGSTATNAWATDFTLTGSTGAQYYIHSMGTKGGSHALQWNTNGYLYCTKAPTSGKKLYSISVTGTDDKNVGLYAQNSAYSSNSGGTSLGSQATGSTYTFTDEYGYVLIKGASSATEINTLTITYGTYTNYMTTCCASAGLTLEGPTGDMVFITSAASKKVRSQEAFHISGCGVSGSQELSFNFGSSALNAKFTCATETGEALTTTCDGRIDTDFYIYYTPGAGDTSDGIDESTSLTASVGGTLSANATLSTKTIIGRHLPAEFVIAGKKDGKWYALPATMSNTAHPAPVEIAVDDFDNPSVAYTDANNKYGLVGPASGNISDGNGQYVKLTMSPLSNAPLFGQAPSNTAIGKSGDAIATNKLSEGWWWKLNQTNTSITNPQDAKYTIYCANNNTNHLRLKDNNGNPEWGLYDSGVDELRLITASSVVPTEAEIVAWGLHNTIVEVDRANAGGTGVSATKVKAKLGGATSSLITLEETKTSKGSDTKYDYTVAFGDGIDFAANEGNMLALEWYNSSDELIAVSNIVVPRIIANGITISKANYSLKGVWNTEVHVLPGITVTVDASAYDNSDVTVKELNIYPGATVNITNGTLKATTLVMRNGWDRLSVAKKYEVARLYITPSDGSLQASTAYSDWYIDYDQYYPIAVPWNVTTASGMTYKNTSSAASDGVKMRYYDGASRAQNVQSGVGESANWKAYSVGGNAYPATLTPGTGYAMTAKRPVGKAFAIVRMTLTIPSTDWTAGGEQGNVSTTYKNQVTVSAHGDASTPVYAKGWNFIANPYMSLHEGALNYTTSGTVEYANIPDENFKEFDQQPILTTQLKPSSGFLIQASQDGTVAFATGSRTANAPQRYNSDA